MNFSDNDVKHALASFCATVDGIPDDEENIYNVRAKRAYKIISSILKKPEFWDERCQFNKKHVGEQFVEWVRDFSAKDEEGVNNIYVLAYRFLCEFDFFVGEGFELTIDLRKLKSEIEKEEFEENDIDGHVKGQIVYAKYFMPANITKELINDSNIGVFKSYEEKVDSAEKLKDEWDKEIEEKEKYLTGLRERLDEVGNAFNFVGLYKGFDEIYEEKKTESRFLLGWLVAMGLLVLTPLTVKAFDLMSSAPDGAGAKIGFGWENIAGLIFFFSIEIVLIYFFRVVLSNYQSVKSQLSQLQVRKTLCQFIQGYADYSEEINKKSKGALDKFEEIIFSNVVADPSKVPSTFDGLDKLAEIFRTVTKK